VSLKRSNSTSSLPLIDSTIDSSITTSQSISLSSAALDCLRLRTHRRLFSPFRSNLFPRLSRLAPALASSSLSSLLSPRLLLRRRILRSRLELIFITPSPILRPHFSSLVAFSLVYSAFVSNPSHLLRAVYTSIYSLSLSTLSYCAGQDSSRLCMLLSTPSILTTQPIAH